MYMYINPISTGATLCDAVVVWGFQDHVATNDCSKHADVLYLAVELAAPVFVMLSFGRLYEPGPGIIWTFSTIRFQTRFGKYVLSVV